MISRTYTNMWNQERKIYSIYELQLPTPVSFKQLGLFAAASIIWMPLMWLIGVRLTTSGGGPWGFILWFGPPIALAIMGNRKLFEGKSIIQWLTSFLRYIRQPKRILDGRGMNLLDKLPKEDESGKIISHDPFKMGYIVWSKRNTEGNNK